MSIPTHSLQDKAAHAIVLWEEILEGVCSFEEIEAILRQEHVRHRKTMRNYVSGEIETRTLEQLLYLQRSVNAYMKEKGERYRSESPYDLIQIVDAQQRSSL